MKKLGSKKIVMFFNISILFLLLFIGLFFSQDVSIKKIRANENLVMDDTIVNSINNKESEYDYIFTGTGDYMTARIISYTGVDKNIEIPATVTTEEGFVAKVVSIGANTFKDCQIESVIIPNTVTAIEENTFSGNNLTNIVLPNNLQSIGNYAFAGNKLTSVKLPDNIISIASGAFSSNEITSLEIPASINEIGSAAFSYNNISTVENYSTTSFIENAIFFSNPVTHIKVPSDYVEKFKENIDEYKILEGVTERTILMSFEGFNYLDESSIKESGSFIKLKLDGVGYQIKSIVGPFRDLEPIKFDWYKNQEKQNRYENPLIIENVTAENSGDYHVVIGEENGQIELPTIEKIITNSSDNMNDFSFIFTDNGGNITAEVVRYTGSSTDIEIPDTAITTLGQVVPVVSIGDSAFFQNELTSVSIPESVTSIGREAFSFNNLANVSIPESVISIKEYAFDNNNLPSVSIPKSVTRIENGVFHNNKLTSISIPESVTSIGSLAFNENKITSIEILGDTSMSSSSFSSNPINQIDVPGHLIEAYKNSFLNTDNLKDITNRTILRSLGGFKYSTENRLDIPFGDTLDLKVDGIGYQLKEVDQSNLEWEPIKFDWYKNQEKLNRYENPLIIENVTAEDSGDYHVVIGEDIVQIQLSSTSVNIFNWEIPPINPIDPNPINPEDSNPDIEALSIRFVSGLDFGKIFVSSLEQTLFSRPSKDIQNQEFPNMITVQDQRKEDRHDKWELTVKQEEELYPGSRIVMSPYVADINKNQFNVSTSKSFEVNNNNQLFASGGGDEIPMHIVSIGMHQPGSQGVELKFPRNTGIGDYHTTLTWNLSVGI
ncbi:leucine-rich repeat protein [Carnobacterium maltaromaticum]|uniref:leucine-rich repeat protein n=1 Tax=Carnobacterium maltaromaticum TaxID=2751 RepID=UPI00295EF676|nr:leucine-rich repeat protein [Carnobacterium maltaromaticum]